MIERGKVYWVNLEPTFGSQQKGRRPCLVMSSDIVNARRRTISVIPLSSSPIAAPPIVVSLDSMGENSVAIIDQLRAVDKNQFGDLIASLTNKEMVEIEKSMKWVFCLD